MHSRNIILSAALAIGLMGTNANAQFQYMPDENAPHEGTWLTWPHHYTYGTTYRNRLDATWVAMTAALVQSEKVHIIAYNSTQRTRIQNLLNAAGVPLAQVNFVLRQSNDCWVRDNGAIYVYSASNTLKATDWGFNGWGYDTPYVKDNTVPTAMASSSGVTLQNLNSIVLEGGAIEVDQDGVMLATRSAILEPDRNPGLTQAQLQNSLVANLGIAKFIWLNGAPGGADDITDMHIDGFARFGPAGTIVTMSPASLAYWLVPSGDITTLYNATDINNVPYNFVQLPLTANNVVTTYGQNLGYKGSYVNFYVANTRVLMPSYNDPNDNVAQAILQGLYPGRTVVKIDCRNLYANGGMVHCVTQQQPVAVPMLAPLANEKSLEAEAPMAEAADIVLFPVPCDRVVTIQVPVSGSVIAGKLPSPDPSESGSMACRAEIMDLNGRVVLTGNVQQAGEVFTTTLDVSALPNGAYLCTVTINGARGKAQRFVVAH